MRARETRAILDDLHIYNRTIYTAAEGKIRQGSLGRTDRLTVCDRRSSRAKRTLPPFGAVMGSRSVRPSLAHNRVIWVSGNIWLWPLGPGAVGSGAGLVVGAQRRVARAGPKQLPIYLSWDGDLAVIPW